MNAKQIYDAIGQVAPFDCAESWDNPGLLVGSPQAEADPLGLALDITPQVLALAKEKRIQTILTHHPVIFHPLKQVRQDSPVFQLIQSDIAVISAHTNLDRSPQLGTNRVLAERLGLWNGSLSPELEEMGVLGELPPCPAPELAKKVKTALGCASVNFYNAAIPCHRVAVIAGSGGSLLEQAAAAGADTLITGDVKQDVFVSAQWLGMNLLEVSHFDLENPVFSKLGPWLEETLGIRTCLLSPQNPVQWI